MPASSQIARPAIRVAASAPLELMWLIHWSGASHSHPDFAVLEELRQRHGPELRKVWAEHPQYSSEMLVLAHRSGTMFDLDLNRFFSRIDASINDRSALPSLLSESPAERELTRERLEQLRSDASLRKRYVDLLQALWSDVHEDWEGTGRAAVTAEAQKWSRALESGTPYRQLLRVQHIWPPRPETDTFADAAEAGGNLTMTPSWFGGHISVLEFDGQVYVGRGIQVGEPSFKQVAAEVSSRIKALADPTRLAILLRLAREPASVTEIARQFGLSQPTVSAHVQVLREAGLLEEKTVGRSAQLSASEEGLHRMFAHAEESLIRAWRP
jgi:DNA-binding transcriptional ArsR family regulator